MDWKSLLDRSSDCGCSTVGRGLPAWIDFGRGASSGPVSAGPGVGAWAGAGVTDRSGGVEVEARFLEAWSTLAAARAGSFRFLSI